MTTNKKAIKMKSLMIKFALVASVLLCFEKGAEGSTNSLDRSSSNEDRVERVKRATGGLIVKPGTQKGTIAYVNSQSKVSSCVISNVVADLRKLTKYNIIATNHPNVTLGSAGASLSALNVQLGIFIVDSSDAPALIVAPEERWGIINVAKLTSDGCEATYSSARLKKEMLRAFAFLCGGVGTRYDNSLLCAVSKPSDLDNVIEERLPVDVISRTIKYLEGYGVSRAVYVEYVDACEQGWAPPPTDKYQKAIWDQTHQIPSKPIKINFDPKVGK